MRESTVHASKTSSTLDSKVITSTGDRMGEACLTESSGTDFDFEIGYHVSRTICIGYQVSGTRCKVLGITNNIKYQVSNTKY